MSCLEAGCFGLDGLLGGLVTDIIVAATWFDISPKNKGLLRARKINNNNNLNY